jgi:hypothetical protein
MHMMTAKRPTEAGKLSVETSAFLKAHPALKEALEVFGMSIEQYRASTEGSTHLFTTNSSNSHLYGWVARDSKGDRSEEGT